MTATTSAAQSISRAEISTADVTGVDFGYNFDTIVNVNDAGQGSLRQFIVNANALSGADTTIFMISDGAAHNGLRAGLTNQLTGGVANIVLVGALPAVTDTNTTIDGTTQTTNVGNTNSGSLGTGGAVGVDNLTLSTVQRPEVQITDGATNLLLGLDLQGTSAIVRGISIYGFGSTATNDGSANIRLGPNAANALIEQTIIGSTAAVFADPGSDSRSGGDNVRSAGADNGILRNNLIGFSRGKGFGVENGSTGWLIENNEIRGNAVGNSNLDGIDFESSGSTGNTARGKLIYDNEGVGVDSYLSNGSNTVVNNTITGNGAGVNSNIETPGVRLYGANNLVDRNIIASNYGVGVMITSGASANTITRNSIYDNGTISTKTGGAVSGQIGIDLLSPIDNASTGTSSFVTLNDNADADAGGNGLLNFPVLENARIADGNLVLTGFARPGASIEFFVAAPDASGFGEGQTYLFTFTEGAAEDADATSATYTSPFGGKTIGTDTTNRFRFSAALPPGVAVGTVVDRDGDLKRGDFGIRQHNRRRQRAARRRSRQNRNAGRRADARRGTDLYNRFYKQRRAGGDEFLID
ncbi:MAG TPA: right-handed parallel beta-helix repeat-containing protein [Pyrinomonadaceae bacterium]|nr:right-handed parallel beta-helix repeat-containing protein [Pyrinomonadaceae bacterium]